MQNAREEAVFGGVGLCIGVTFAQWLPMPHLAVPLIGLTMTVAMMAAVALTGFQFEGSVPRRLQSIQQYARVTRL